MALSATAMTGIEDHGLRWRLEIDIGVQVERLRDVDQLVVGDCATIRDEIVRRVRLFLAAARTQRVLDAQDRASFELTIDDLEQCADDPDELRIAMDDLFDKLDYFRIVVVG